MKFGALQRRVKRCEQVVAVRMGETEDNWSQLGRVWKQGWSPLRIVVAGLAGGFVAGKLEMPHKVSGARWLQMIGSVSSLMASGQAAFASAMAAHAAHTADDAADTADAAVEQAPVAAANAAAAAAAGAAAAVPRAPAPAAHPEPAVSATPAQPQRDPTQGPRPAEAATELSER